MNQAGPCSLEPANEWLAHIWDVIWSCVKQFQTVGLAIIEASIQHLPVYLRVIHRLRLRWQCLRLRIYMPQWFCLSHVVYTCILLDRQASSPTLPLG